MNQTLQSDHPGTEQLSAFLAHVLPAHEHDLTIAHLAKCSYCRSIVFRLQDISVETTTDSMPASSSVPWFKNWKWIVPTATVLSAVVTGVFFLNKRPTELPQRASTVPPTEIASTPPHAMYPPPSVDRIAPSPLSNKTHLSHNRSASPKASSGTPAEVGGEQPSSSNGSLNRPINGRDLPTLIPLTPNSSPSGDSTPESGRQPGGIAGGAAAGMIAPVAPAGGSSLPSGALVVSSASNGTRTLALDRQGNLFLTSNGGRTWQQPARSWDGKAVTIAFSGVPNRTTPEAHHGSGFPRGRFELQTDTGAVWLSFDGTHWMKKTP
jgi:hypothetical protein